MGDGILFNLMKLYRTRSNNNNQRINLTALIEHKARENKDY